MITLMPYSYYIHLIHNERLTWSQIGSSRSSYLSAPIFSYGLSSTATLNARACIFYSTDRNPPCISSPLSTSSSRLQRALSFSSTFSSDLVQKYLYLLQVRSKILYLNAQLVSFAVRTLRTACLKQFLPGLLEFFSLFLDFSFESLVLCKLIVTVS